MFYGTYSRHKTFIWKIKLLRINLQSHTGNLILHCSETPMCNVSKRSDLNIHLLLYITNKPWPSTSHGRSCKVIIFRVYLHPKLSDKLYVCSLSVTFLALNPHTTDLKTYWHNSYMGIIKQSWIHSDKSRTCLLWAISPFITMFSKAVCIWKHVGKN